MIALLNRDQDRARRWMRLRYHALYDSRRRKRMRRLDQVLHSTPEGRIWAAIEEMGLGDPVTAAWARQSTVERARGRMMADYDPVLIGLPDGTVMFTGTTGRGAKWHAGFQHAIREKWRRWLFRPDVIVSPAREEAEKGEA